MYFREKTSSSSGTNQFYDANEGYLKGNMSKNIYEEYKNYSPMDVKIKDKKEALLLFILKCDFAIHDLTLYLDIHSDDQKANDLMNFYKKELEKAMANYQDIYGPLCDNYIANTFKWNEPPFPWEK